MLGCEVALRCCPDSVDSFLSLPNISKHFLGAPSDALTERREERPSQRAVRLSGHRLALELSRAAVPQGAVQPAGVVKALDVGEELSPSGLETRERAPELGLEGLEEALRHRVVPAVAFSAHADHSTDPFETPAVVLRTVLLGFQGSSQRCVVEQSARSNESDPLDV